MEEKAFIILFLREKVIDSNILDDWRKELGRKSRKEHNVWNSIYNIGKVVGNNLDIYYNQNIEARYDIRVSEEKAEL